MPVMMRVMVPAIEIAAGERFVLTVPYPQAGAPGGHHQSTLCDVRDGGQLAAGSPARHFNGGLPGPPRHSSPASPPMRYLMS